MYLRQLLKRNGDGVCFSFHLHLCYHGLFSHLSIISVSLVNKIIEMANFSCRLSRRFSTHRRRQLAALYYEW
jgi:hypothetical protein